MAYFTRLTYYKNYGAAFGYAINSNTIGSPRR